MATPGDYSTNLELWLKADAITGLTDGDPISTWTDSSGLGAHATATTTARPTYKASALNGLAVARFAGAQYMGSLAPSWNAAQTVVAVVKSTNLAATNTIRGGTRAVAQTGGLQFRIEATGNPNNLRFVREGVADIGQGNVLVTASTWHVVTGTWDDASNSYAFTIDGAAAGSGSSAVNLTAARSTTIGANGSAGSGPSELFIGDIAEIAAWSRVLNSTDLGAVVAGLTAKWLPTAVPAGTGSGAFTWAGSATGARAPKGSATGAFTWVGSAAGTSTRRGSATGSFAWAGAAVGAAPLVDAPNDGAGSGSFSWVGVAVGKSSPVGTAAGAFTWSGVAVGGSAHSGTASGAFTWVGVAVGTASGTPSGSASGTFGWTGLAFGDNGDLPTVTCLIHRPVGVVPAVSLVPAAELAEAEPILRVSHQMPALSAENPAYTARVDYPVVKDVVGYVHLWIDQRDVTYFRDTPTIIRRWESEAPFGDTVAAFEFPQLNPWDKPGEGDLDFLYPDAPVRIGIVNEDGDVRIVWRGFLDARGNGTAGEREDYAWEAKGLLWQAQHWNREPYPYTEPMDLGELIARVLNAVEGRRWRTIPWTPIGIKTLTRGARDDTAWEFVQRLLAEAITADGRQWTLSVVENVGVRLVLKPAPSTVHATFAYGSPGIDTDLRIDESTRIDRIFGRGIGPRGGGWANVFFPGLELVNAPTYPFASPTTYFGLGTTDADTTSGTGITDWQRRVNEIRGFANPPVSGVMSAAWMAVVDDLQRTVGVTPDGSPGPQTWNATFDRGMSADSEALKPRRLAIASKPSAEKYLYSATGVRLGVNPAYDGSRIIRDIGIDFGAGKTKAEGRKLARSLLSMYGNAAAYGTIKFTFDPNGTDRTTLSHLSNVKVLGHESTDRTLQIASKSVELDQGEDGPVYVVTCRVDEHQRDAMYVEDLLEQRRSAQADPARRPGQSLSSSRNVEDQRMPWDSESPCGVLRRTAINGGLWTVVTIPFAEVGKLASIRLHSDRPFSFAIFASLRITENKLAAIVGDPSDSTNPWRPHWDALEPYGIIEAWGEQDNRCGYSPLTEDEDGATFTGDFILDSPVDYWTETPPYVSVAIYMHGGSGWISGNFYPAYEGA